jgi:hypothetical protein
MSTMSLILLCMCACSIFGENIIENLLNCLVKLKFMFSKYLFVFRIYYENCWGRSSSEGDLEVVGIC